MKGAALAAGMALSVLVLRPVAAEAAAPLPPPYEGAYQPRGVDEIGFWREDDESEKVLATSDIVIRDAALAGYVTKVLCETVGADRCRSARVYILREPAFSATMSPNGTMRVFSGLLLRMRSEAELSAVLGHEFGHFERRHGLDGFKARRAGTDILAWASVLSSAAATYGGRQNNQAYQNLQLQVYGNLFRFNRDQEREADILGISYLNNSALRPQSAADVWRNAMAEAEASARVKGLAKPNFNAIAFTASHPPNAERAGYLADLAQPDAAARDDGAARYRAALAPWLPLFLADQIKLNDFGASDYVIQSLAQNGWTAPLWLARGDLYRGRGNPRDLVLATEFYSHALELDGALAEAYRGLGLSRLKTGQRSEGIEALGKYLHLKPDASDASMIRIMLPKEVTTN